MSESVDENITETYKELIRMYENEVIRMRGIIDHQEKEFVFIYIYVGRTISYWPRDHIVKALKSNLKIYFELSKGWRPTFADSFTWFNSPIEPQKQTLKKLPFLQYP